MDEDKLISQSSGVRFLAQFPKDITRTKRRFRGCTPFENCETSSWVPGGERLWGAKLRGCSVQPSHGTFRFNRTRALADGFGGESIRARKRACASSSKKNMR